MKANVPLLVLICSALFCVTMLIVPSCSSSYEKRLKDAKTYTLAEWEEKVRLEREPPPDGAFVGPQPVVERSFSEGKADAEADFHKTVAWATGLIIWGGLGFSIIIGLASFFFPWASIKAAMTGLVVVIITVCARYLLKAFGIITLDVGFYVLIGLAAIIGTAIGVPIVVSWVKKLIHRNGERMAAEALKPELSHNERVDKARAATAVLAVADNKVNKNRKQVAKVLSTSALPLTTLKNLVGVKLKGV